MRKSRPYSDSKPHDSNHPFPVVDPGSADESLEPLQILAAPPTAELSTPRNWARDKLSPASIWGHRSGSTVRHRLYTISLAFHRQLWHRTPSTSRKVPSICRTTSPFGPKPDTVVLPGARIKGSRAPMSIGVTDLPRRTDCFPRRGRCGPPAERCSHMKEPSAAPSPSHHSICKGTKLSERGSAVDWPRWRDATAIVSSLDNQVFSWPPCCYLGLLSLGVGTRPCAYCSSPYEARSPSVPGRWLK